MRLLVVEDEKDLNSIIVKNLEAEGYGEDAGFLKSPGDSGLLYGRHAPPGAGGDTCYVF